MPVAACRPRRFVLSRRSLANACRLASDATESRGGT
jgi:hypothetical protein